MDRDPYTLSYELETGPRFVTRRLSVACRSAGWSRTLLLVREEDGRWHSDAGSVPELGEALDCDLARSPLTNTMPVLRHRLREGGDAVEFVMAWISVPDLSLHRSAQRYTHLHPLPGGGALVRFESDGFTADIEFDAAGFVTSYPGLAHRII